MLKENVLRKYMNFYNTKLGRDVLNKEIEFVESRLKGCKMILSIGCGPALLETNLQELHPEMKIVGLDRSQEMIERSSKSINLQYGEANFLGFYNNIFDAALFVTSLEFINEYEKAVREVHRVLKPKGKILILMLNSKSNYFKNEYSDKNSYIRKNIINFDNESIKSCISQYFLIENEEYSLGIKGRDMVISNDPKIASIYVLEGIKFIK